MTDVWYSISQFRINCLSLRLAAATALVMWLAAHFDGESTVLAQSPAGVAAEYDLKLTYIYLTAKRITWPDDGTSSTAPFVIGVVDSDPFQGGLQKLQKLKKLKERPIQVVLIKSSQDYQPCHILFIPREAKPSIVDEILIRAADQPILIWRDQLDPDGPPGVSCAFIPKDNSPHEFLIYADPVELKRRNLAAQGQLMSLNIIRMVKPTK